MRNWKQFEKTFWTKSQTKNTKIQNACTLCGLNLAWLSPPPYLFNKRRLATPETLISSGLGASMPTFVGRSVCLSVSGKNVKNCQKLWIWTTFGNKSYRSYWVDLVNIFRPCVCPFVCPSVGMNKKIVTKKGFLSIQEWTSVQSHKNVQRTSTEMEQAYRQAQPQLHMEK